MRHLSLFSGIGGFDLAARWAGWENVAAVEKEPFCQKVLKYHFPTTKIYSDVKEFDGKPYKGTIDVISGGFPCQPFSVAGKQQAQNDDRFLWPEMLRIIKEIRPRFIVGENVTGIIKLALDEVLTSLENEGYTTETFIIPACAVQAPHRRDRVWVVAYSKSKSSWGELFKRQRKGEFRGHYSKKNATNSDRKRLERENGQKEKRDNAARLVTNSNGERLLGKEHRKKGSGRATEKSIYANWENFPTQSPVRGRNDGLPPKLDGITFPKWRNESIKAMGNAIVPQIAYQIFQAINKIK